MKDGCIYYLDISYLAMNAYTSCIKEKLCTPCIIRDILFRYNLVNHLGKCNDVSYCLIKQTKNLDSLEV